MAQKFKLFIVVLSGFALLTVRNTFAAEGFYKDQTIKFVVGFSAGGGFDAYTRLIARYMVKYIPGNPTVIVQNMPGAGSLVAANYLYNQAKPDGLTIGNWIGGFILQQYFADPAIKFDAHKFEWIGAPDRIDNICLFSKQSGINSVDKWLGSKTPVKLGATPGGGPSPDIPKILMRYSKLPIQLIEGYKGLADVRLAIEAGEVAGGCMSWAGTKSSAQAALQRGDMIVVLQVVEKAISDLPKVPLSVNYINSDEGHQMMKTAVYDTGVINRPYSLPPGTPKDRVQLLRTAFEATLKDAEFLARAKEAKLDINTVTGEEVEKTISNFKTVPPAVFSKLKQVLTTNR